MLSPDWVISNSLSVGGASRIIHCQSIKAPHARGRGYAAGKNITGRKRHISVDSDGRLLLVGLTPADISDSAGGQMIFNAIHKRLPVKHQYTISQSRVREFRVNPVSAPLDVLASI